MDNIRNILVLALVASLLAACGGRSIYQGDDSNEPPPLVRVTKIPPVQEPPVAVIPPVVEPVEPDPGPSIPEICFLKPALHNGQRTTNHPASGYIETDVGVCSGTLVHTRTFLTAAHCLDGAEWIQVYIGDSVYYQGEVILHPDYETNDEIVANYNDIALLILNEDVYGVWPAQLATEPPVQKSDITLVGFGVSERDGEDYGKKREGPSIVVRNEESYFVVAGESTICSGDSGGSVYDADGTLVGVSWATPWNSCEIGYITSVSYFHDWIVQNAVGNCG